VAARNVAATDIAVTGRSTVYFADAVHRTIGYIDEQGRTRTLYDGGEIAMPSVLALSPDQAMLIVTDRQSRFSWSFQIAGDGSLINGEPFYRLETPESGWKSGVQGAVEDADGQVYFASPLVVQFCEANGRVAGILNPPEHGVVTGLAFAGEESGLALRRGRRQAVSSPGESEGSGGGSSNQGACGAMAPL